MQQYSTTDDLYHLDAFYSSQATETASSHLQYASYPGLVSAPSLNYCTPQTTNNGFASQHPQYSNAYDQNCLPQRHVPSTRAYSYHPYSGGSTGPVTPGAYSPVQVSPRVSHYVSPWETASGLISASSLSVGNEYSFVDYSVLNGMHGNGTIHPSQLFNTQPESCATAATVATVPTTVDPHSLTSHTLYNNVSPASLEDSSSSDDRDSSPLSADSAELPTPSLSSTSTRSTPARPGLTIPTVSLISKQHQETPIWSNSNSTLPSPVDSLSSKASSSDHEPSFIPTPSLKKSTASVKGAKRATRSAAPEPAWVEAVLKEDANRILQQDSAVSPTAPARGANRPIAFACVFCRHRKIQCIRPKTEVAPGEKPAPCNQCEKRNRCCEYPPAALNPRVVRRARDRPSSTSVSVAGEC
ncbi:5605_t:CDS:2 [Acaulospora colombiana]|uniref:5605_t:CDS:1 n=1 Tax=Acaulospora colombiana TaxID=27376 RepID=A0ACA9NPJ8_9GLOM|nr:5605_t:CDS:2 [Acaulospora colombiana]